MIRPSPIPIALTPAGVLVHTDAMWRWRVQPQPGVPSAVADECETLERVIRTTGNTAVAEFARLRLRAARFARDHATPTPAAAPPRAMGAAELEAEIRRSSATVTHVTRSADLVDVTPRLPLLARIAETNRPRYDEVAHRPPDRTRTPPLMVALPVLAAVAAFAVAVAHDALVRDQDPFVSLIGWANVNADLAASGGVLLAISACLAARARWLRRHPRLLPPEDEG